ncbi:hypothetical protein ES703_87471 [subsurface metagenome]
MVKTVKPNIRNLIIQILEEGGPSYPYSVYRKLRDGGNKVRYGTVRWQVLFLAREGIIRAIPRGEAEYLGLQVTPDRSGKSGKRPPMNRRYYELIQG